MQQLNLFSEIDRDKITLDLFQAYFDARKNKRNTINALAFEKHLEANLFALASEIIERRYSPKPSICFIVDKPVKREIFAADFRDRVIHHFIYNYISPIFEKSFINDSYSCRKGKGTHYGINRIDHFIRSCSQNYNKDCYILKLDIKGYFMAMNKLLLFDKVKNELIRNKNKVDFDWEEFYIFGPGDDNEYKELKKSRPSYHDTFNMIRVDNYYDDDYGLFAKVTRISDKKRFQIPLADLKAIDEKSNNYQILDDYSVWFVNY
jgi:retron-type reverse transcriptase